MNVNKDAVCVMELVSTQLDPIIVSALLVLPTTLQLTHVWVSIQCTLFLDRHACIAMNLSQVHAIFQTWMNASLGYIIVVMMLAVQIPLEVMNVTAMRVTMVMEGSVSVSSLYGTCVRL